MVGTGLGCNCHTHHGDAVHLHVTLYVTRAELGLAYVAESDYLGAVMLYDQVVELLGGVHLAKGTDLKLGGVTLDGTGWELHVLAVQGGDAVTGHLDGVKPQTHAVTLFTPYHHGTHVLDGLELLLNHQVCKFTEFKQCALITVQGNHEDRHGVGIGLGYRGGIAVAGQHSLGA